MALAVDAEALQFDTGPRQSLRLDDQIAGDDQRPDAVRLCDLERSNVDLHAADIREHVRELDKTVGGGRLAGRCGYGDRQVTFCIRADLDIHDLRIAAAVGEEGYCESTADVARGQAALRQRDVEGREAYGKAPDGCVQ